jgi:hypothetical protein
VCNICFIFSCVLRTGHTIAIQWTIPNMGSRSSRVKPRTIEIGICCFSGNHAPLYSNNRDWLIAIKIMWPSGVTCLAADCCFSGLSL